MAVTKKTPVKKDSPLKGKNKGFLGLSISESVLESFKEKAWELKYRSLSSAAEEAILEWLKKGVKIGKK